MVLKLFCSSIIEGALIQSPMQVERFLTVKEWYSTIEREYLAVVFDVFRFNYYLQGRKFNLEVDNKPLLYHEYFKG